MTIATRSGNRQDLSVTSLQLGTTLSDAPHLAEERSGALDFSKVSELLRTADALLG